MSAIYEENKDEDGFLYMTYSGENTFGSLWKMNGHWTLYILQRNLVKFSSNFLRCPNTPQKNPSLSHAKFKDFDVDIYILWRLLITCFQWYYFFFKRKISLLVLNKLDFVNFLRRCLCTMLQVNNDQSYWFRDKKYGLECAMFLLGIDIKMSIDLFLPYVNMKPYSTWA